MYCTPASRLKKESGVNHRDIGSLMEGGSYLSEARSWSDIPPCTANGRQDVAASRGRGRLPVTEGIDIRLAHGLPGKPGETYLPFEKLS